MFNRHIFGFGILKITCVFFAFRQLCEASTVPYIGIIGAGIGGSLSSLYVKQLFGENGAQIDIYERKKVGGRAAVVKIGENSYEAGASIIHGRNRYLSDLAQTLGLEKRQTFGGKLAIYDGKNYVFIESSYTMCTYFHIFWRYGWSLIRWNNLISTMLEKFDKIYQHQDKGYSFTSVDKLLYSMDESFIKATQMTTKEYLEHHGFSSRFIKELATAVTRVNYGQNTSVNGFVGSVSLAAADSHLWSVEGGNYKLAEGALNLSQAKLIRSTADKVTLKDGKYLVSSVSLDENNNEQQYERLYDILIVAAPQTSDLASIKFIGFPHIHADFPGRYHQTVATFVNGKINSTYFGFDSSEDFGDVISINMASNYNSVSRNYPVEASRISTDVWKLFSQVPLRSSTLDEMFYEITSVKVVDWLAYPHYTPPEKLGTFQIHDRLYYTSSIEWAASAMEMSAIAARNVALLAYNHWAENNDLIDITDIPEDERIEL